MAAHHGATLPQGLWQPYTNLLTPPNIPELCNAIGEIMYSTINDEIAVCRYAKGMYYIRCEKEVKKVVVD